MRVYYRPTRNYREHPGGEEEEEEEGEKLVYLIPYLQTPAPPSHLQREPLAREPHGKVERQTKRIDRAAVFICRIRLRSSILSKLLISAVNVRFYRCN